MKRILNIFIGTVLFFCLLSCGGGKAPQTVFLPDEQEEAARQLIRRVTGDHARDFVVRITAGQQDEKDWFAVSALEDRILLEGNDGVSVASALNFYLKKYCGWHYTWCGQDTLLPETLPLPEGREMKTSPYQYRYYLNYCTFNYSMSWWDFERWQREIDFMAMNGINLPLAVTGQNSVWQKVYNRLGISNQELESFFSGPAYFNWFWMGNLDGWGGPLPQSFIDRHEQLQKQILLAERSLGMKPVLPAFTGHVPPVFAEKFPDVKVSQTRWSNFAPVSILDPEEEMFTEIGKMFIEEQEALYGTNHYYTADTFNENLPPSNDSLFLDRISRKVYHSMSEVDPEAIWVMQGWLFYHDRDFWGDDQIRALLGGVPDDRMLILDLWSERHPVWNRTEAYYGKPWIWCMLHNFGQNITLSGNVRSVANDPARALADPASGNMKGIGLTMEGIGQNPAIYSLMLENVWRDEPVDTDQFLQEYLRNRYGQVLPEALEAWQILFSDVLENEVNSGGHESILTGCPTFKENPRRTTNTEKHYETASLLAAWDHMMQVADQLSGRDGFRYDLTDLSRQALADYASTVQQEAARAYEQKDMEAFQESSAAFLDLIRDLDGLLATRKEFLLGPWLEDAKAMGTTREEKDLYEKNARDLLTLWGNPECTIADYACRQWSGLMEGFYLKRWEKFFAGVGEAMAAGREFDQEAFTKNCREWEWTWVNSHECYPVVPSGDEIERCRYIYGKYRQKMLQL